MRHFITRNGSDWHSAALLLLFTPFLMSTAIADEYWLAQTGGLARWDRADATATVRVTDVSVRAFAVDAGSGDAWLFDGKDLQAFSSDGERIRRFPAYGLNGSGADGFAVAGERVWLASGRQLLIYSRDGQPVADVRLPAPAADMAVSAEGAAYVAVGGDLLRFDGNGFEQVTHALSGQSLHVVGVSDHAVWAADQQLLYRVHPLTGEVQSLPHALNGDLVDLRADGDGGVWLLGLHRALRVSAALQTVAAADVFPAMNNGGSGRAVNAVEAGSGSLWVLGQRDLLLLDAAGMVTGRLDVTAITGSSDAIVGMERSADTSPPELAFVLPAEGALLNNARPLLSLDYSDSGSGVDTGTLVIRQAGNVVDVSCTFAAETADCQPLDALPEGDVVLSASIADQAGNTATTAERRFRIDTVPPAAPAAGMILVERDEDGRVTVTGDAGSVEPGATVRLVNRRSGESIDVTADADGAFAAVLQGEPEDAIDIVVVDAAGNSSDATRVHVPSPGPAIRIESPLPGAFLSGTRLLVEGSFSGLEHAGVVVNGVPALVTGDGRYVAEIPLEEPGNHAISAQLMNAEGEQALHRIDVTVEVAAEALTLRPSAVRGVDELLVAFDVLYDAELIDSVQIDFEGDGAFDYTGAEISEPILHHYPAPGLFRPRARVISAAGTHEAETAILVTSTADEVAVMRAAWDAMNAAVVAGDTERALAYVLPDSRERYRPVFEALSPHFGEIVASYRDVRAFEVTGDWSEFAVNRTVDGVDRLFLVYFTRGNDGLWRLSEM